MTVPISEQVIVITGASSGIGVVTAKKAAFRGAHVVLSARNETDLDQAVQEIRRKDGKAIAVPADVSNYAQVETLAQKAVDTYGRIDTWVNNAAVTLYAPFRHTSLEDFQRVLEVNLMGQVHGAKAALRYLEETAGALVCVGSVESDRGLPLQSAYAASKHAIKGWLDAFRVELQKESSRVRVTLIKPASINTPLFEHAKTQIGVEPRGYPPAYRPELVADAILLAAEHDNRDVYVGTAGKALSLLERLSPRLVDLQMKLTGYRLQRTDKHKSADSHNLYAPLSQNGGGHRQATKLELERSLYPWVSEHSVGVPLAMILALGAGALVLRTAMSRSS